jgi:Tfp pilus assembly protein PilN
MRAVNLLPGDEARSARRGPGVVLQLSVAGGLVVVGALAGAFFLTHGKVADKRKALDAAQAELARTPAPVVQGVSAQTAALQAQQSARLSVLASALTGRMAWDRVLHELSLVLPDNVWLTSLSAQAPVSAASGTPVAADPNAAPSEFSVVGYTYSQEGVAQMLTRLALVPDLANVTLQGSSATKVAGQSVVQFTIVANLRAPGAAS